MTPDVVVDIGNSRMKWGVCRDGVVKEKASLPLDETMPWQSQWKIWGLAAGLRWAVAGVNPGVEEHFLQWLNARTPTMSVIRHMDIKGIKVAVEEPLKVGIDRLLTALAARRFAPRERPVIVISIGTAMTIDLVDADGTFAGGAILPGPALMARSLHQYTAKLPRITIDPAVPLPAYGRNTREAIELGIGAAVVGAADYLVWEWANRFEPKPQFFITGGDSGYFSGFEFAADIEPPVIHDFLTLEGIRIAAESLP
jgi:type III pantothenate kinase